MTVSYTHLVEIKENVDYSETDYRKIDELLGNEKPKKAENFETLGYSEQEFEGEELVSVEAVSYTHLDVYKRQGFKSLEEGQKVTFDVEKDPRDSRRLKAVNVCAA